MNEHEAQRIAAAMHQLRPDWPASSLLTLIRKNLMDRPRRDVTVALAWVACESGTATPARVLESGPWWRAAAVEGTATARREWPDDAHRCSVCSLPRERCVQLWTDHEFLPASAKADIDVNRAVAGLRDIKATDPPPERPEPPEPTPNPHVEALRAELTTATDVAPVVAPVAAGNEE